MTSISNNVYINKLDYIVNEHNNTYHRKIKIKPVDVKNYTYIDSSKEFNNKNFQIGDHGRISKQKHIFAKTYTLNCSEEVSVISKIKNNVPWTYVINGLNGDHFIKNN